MLSEKKKNISLQEKTNTSTESKMMSPELNGNKKKKSKLRKDLQCPGDSSPLDVVTQTNKKKKRKPSSESEKVVPEKKMKFSSKSETIEALKKAVEMHKKGHEVVDSDEAESDDELAMDKYRSDFGFDSIEEDLDEEKEEESEEEEEKEVEPQRIERTEEEIQDDLKKTVHVVNVPLSAKKKELVKLFKKYGTVVSLR